MIDQKCQHEWIEDGNKIICKLCNTSKLKRVKINDEISYGIKSDGTKYTIRKDRNKYFYPQQWIQLYNSLSDKHKLLFDFLIKTGARIDEALHFKKTNLVDDKRKVIRLTVTKRKAKKLGEEYGKPRSFEIEGGLYNELKAQQHLYVFLDKDTEMTLKESKAITKLKVTGVRELFKRHLKEIGLDPLQYGLHNIRKTHGMWLKALDISVSEICLRLGHNQDTYLSNYGSPSIFDGKDKEQMIKILGRIYNL